MAATSVLVRTEQGIAVVTLNRPEARNALDRATRRALLAALEQIAGDRTVRVVILTGAGDKAFCAGGDLSEVEKFTPLEARDYAEGENHGSDVH